MVEYFSFTFGGRNIVFINLNILRCRLIANIGAIDCSEMKKDPYWNHYAYATFKLYSFERYIENTYLRFETGSLEFVELLLLDLRAYHKNFVRLNTEK